MLGSGTIHSQASMFVKIMFFFLHYLLQSAWSAASLKKIERETTLVIICPSGSANRL